MGPCQNYGDVEKNEQVCWLEVNICIMKHESYLTKVYNVYTNTYKYQEVQNKPKS
jgi:hypothetical protein